MDNSSKHSILPALLSRLTMPSMQYVQHAICEYAISDDACLIDLTFQLHQNMNLQLLFHHKCAALALMTGNMSAEACLYQ